MNDGASQWLPPGRVRFSNRTVPLILRALAHLCFTALIAIPLSSHAGNSPTPGGSDGIEVPPFPGYRSLCINEIQPRNGATLYDNRQETDPWIELYNPNDKTVSLDGYALSDNYYAFRKWIFPKGSTIAGRSYLVVWLDGEPEQTRENTLHSSLRLNPEGGALVLSRLTRDVPLVVDYLTYPAVGEDFSYGVAFSALGTRSRLFTRPTPGEPNELVAPVVINEWLVSPPNNEASWFELYCPDPQGVELDGLVLFLFSDAFQSQPFVIPPGRTIKGKGFLRVWADGEPGLNDKDKQALHVPFRLPTSPFTLQLFDSTGRILISQVVSKASDPTRSEGRYPDGARNIDLVNLATPAAPNVGLPSISSLTPPFRAREGTSQTIQVEATGSPTLRYRWTHNGRLLFNATGPTLDFRSVTSSNSGLYTVIVSNSAGSTSRETVMTVLDLPVVELTTPPVVEASIGKQLRLPTRILGSGPFTFQWKRNGQNISSANLQDYTKDTLDLTDGGLYTAVVRNEAGVTLSIPVRVEFPEIPKLKMADLFAEQTDLGTALTGRIRGSNVGAKKERGEPAHAGNAGGHSVWFHWKAPTTGIARFHTQGSSLDTLLAVYQGKSVLELARINQDDDSGGYYTSSLLFNAVKGQNYAVAVDGFGGDTNEFVLSWSVESTTDLIPVITSQPASVVVKPGGKTVFSVTAENASSFQWYFNGRAIAGANDNVLSLADISIKQVGIYTVRVQGKSRFRFIESDDARLELGDEPREPTSDKYEPPFQPFEGVRLPSLNQVTLAGPAFVSVSAGTIGNQTLTTAGSATQITEPPPCGNIGGSSRIQVFSPTTDCEIIIDTIGSTYNTVLAVYSVGSKPVFKYETCNANGPNSEVRFNAKAGLAYYAFVDSIDGSSGITTLNWRCGNLPILVSPAPPQTNSIPAGSSKLLSIVASANPSLQNIQWLQDNNLLSSGLSPNFSIPNAVPENAGDYFVVLSNMMGSVTGKVANLFVEVPFEISVSKTNTATGPKALLKAISDQGFLVETSTNLADWCVFAAAPDPTNPFSLLVTNTLDHPRLFFRCLPWPVDPGYSPTPCSAGFP